MVESFHKDELVEINGKQYPRFKHMQQMQIDRILWSHAWFKFKCKTCDMEVEDMEENMMVMDTEYRFMHMLKHHGMPRNGEHITGFTEVGHVDFKDRGLYNGEMTPGRADEIKKQNAEQKMEEEKRQKLIKKKQEEARKKGTARYCGKCNRIMVEENRWEPCPRGQMIDELCEVAKPKPICPDCGRVLHQTARDDTHRCQCGYFGIRGSTHDLMFGNSLDAENLYRNIQRMSPAFQNEDDLQ